ncbi:hypothetical protein ACH5RR_003278 [Cinchona calisaya]|uniref:Uncharacterized protein n=1 Tax=Cinchona calisaya TaxID=153742 RepID=A0ABD3AUC1_9GENT
MKNKESLHWVQENLRWHLCSEEEFINQKARIKWLEEEDSNSKSFCSNIREKHAKLAIHHINDSGGQWIEDEQVIKGKAISFFQQLLIVESHDQLAMDRLLQNIPC